MKKVLFGIAILAIAIISQAQRGQGGFGFGGAGGGGKLALLAREDVKTDLALTDDQQEKLKAANPMASGDREAMMAQFQEIMKEAGISDFSEMRTPEGQKKMAPIMAKRMAEMQKKMEAILTPEQNKRLGEINIQFYGNRVVTQADVAKAVGLTEDQNKKIADLSKSQSDAMRGLFAKVQAGEMTMEDVQEKRKKNDEILETEIGKVLTDDQKAKLKTMAGTKKFERKDEGN